jgi:hypothetical protein
MKSIKRAVPASPAEFSVRYGGVWQEYNERIVAAEAKMKSSDEAYLSATTERDALRQENEALRKKFKDSLASLTITETNHLESKQILQKVHDEHRDLSRRCLAAEAHADWLQDQVKQGKDTIAVKNEEIATLYSRIVAFKKSLEEANTKNKDLTTTIEQHEGHIAQLMDTLSTRDEELVIVSKSAHSKDKQIVALVKERNSLKEVLLAAQTSLARLKRIRNQQKADEKNASTPSEGAGSIVSSTTTPMNGPVDTISRCTTEDVIGGGKRERGSQPAWDVYTQKVDHRSDTPDASHRNVGAGVAAGTSGGSARTVLQACKPNLLHLSALQQVPTSHPLSRRTLLQVTAEGSVLLSATDSLKGQKDITSLVYSEGDGKGDGKNDGSLCLDAVGDLQEKIAVQDNAVESAHDCDVSALLDEMVKQHEDQVANVEESSISAHPFGNSAEEPHHFDHEVDGEKQKKDNEEEVVFVGGHIAVKLFSSPTRDTARQKENYSNRCGGVRASLEENKVLDSQHKENKDELLQDETKKTLESSGKAGGTEVCTNLLPELGDLDFSFIGDVLADHGCCNAKDSQQQAVTVSADGSSSSSSTSSLSSAFTPPPASETAISAEATPASLARFDLMVNKMLGGGTALAPPVPAPTFAAECADHIPASASAPVTTPTNNCSTNKRASLRGSTAAPPQPQVVFRELPSASNPWGHSFPSSTSCSSSATTATAATAALSATRSGSSVRGRTKRSDIPGTTARNYTPKRGAGRMPTTSVSASVGVTVASSTHSRSRSVPVPVSVPAGEEVLPVPAAESLPLPLPLPLPLLVQLPLDKLQEYAQREKELQLAVYLLQEEVRTLRNDQQKRQQSPLQQQQVRRNSSVSVVRNASACKTAGGVRTREQDGTGKNKSKHVVRQAQDCAANTSKENHCTAFILSNIPADGLL